MAKGTKRWGIPALDPNGGPQTTWEVWVEQVHIDGLTRCGVGPRYARILLIPKGVAEPTAVFQDLKRDGLEEAFCYVSHPGADFRSTTIETPQPPGMVFLVFVMPSGRITEWRWEKCDEENKDYPEGFKQRFREIVWPIKLTL